MAYRSDCDCFACRGLHRWYRMFPQLKRKPENLNHTRLRRSAYNNDVLRYFIDKYTLKQRILVRRRFDLYRKVPLPDTKLGRRFTVKRAFVAMEKAERC